MPRWIKDENGNVVTGKIRTYKCVQCGKESRWMCGKNSSNKYCSYACYWAARQEKHVCAICGNPTRRDKRGDRWLKTCSDDCKMKLNTKNSIGKKCAHPFPPGKENPNYKHGKTEELHALRNTVAYSQWRAAVFVRDHFTCVMCGKHGGNIQADHIKPFAINPDLRFEVDNGRTLCEKCHKHTPTYGHKFMQSLRSGDVAHSQS